MKNEENTAFTINKLSTLTGIDRRTLKKNLNPVQPESWDGPNPLYTMGQALASMESQAGRRKGGSGDLKDDLLRAQIEKVRLHCGIIRGEYVKFDEVKQSAAAAGQNLKNILTQGPASLAPQVVGVTIQEAETILKQWTNAALERFWNSPLGDATFRPDN